MNIDSSQIINYPPELLPERPTVEACGEQYLHITNMPTAGRDEIDPVTGYFTANLSTVAHVLMEAGFVIATENHGYAKMKCGTVMEGNMTTIAASANVETGYLIGPYGRLESKIHELVGGRSFEGSDSFGPSQHNKVDIRDARAALDAALEQEEFADAAEVARRHRERVFGKG